MSSATLHITHVLRRYAYPITCTSYTKDSSGRVVEVRVEYDAEYAQRGVKPPKGVVNWVAQPAPGQDPPVFEGRLYDVLFQSEEPAELDDWLADLNPSSKEVLPHAFANPALAKAAVGSRCVSAAWGLLHAMYPFGALLTTYSTVCLTVDRAQVSAGAAGIFLCGQRLHPGALGAQSDLHPQGVGGSGKHTAQGCLIAHCVRVCKSVHYTLHHHYLCSWNHYGHPLSNGPSPSITQWNAMHTNPPTCLHTTGKSSPCRSLQHISRLV